MADTKEVLYCPACNAEMKKISLPELGINVDVCTDGCGGIYFDNRELAKVHQSDCAVEMLSNLLSEQVFKPVDTDARRVCPACGTNMVKLGGGSGIEYDSCNVCGGKFLDNGELRKMKDFCVHNEDNFDKAMDKLYPQDVKLNARHQFFVDLFTGNLFK